MSEGTLLALLQINVAIGCLYCGLPVARYRSKLHDVIVTAINSHDRSYVAIADEIEDMFKNDGRLSSDHHYIRQWVRELPESDLKRIEDYDKWDISGEYPQPLPRLYRLYFRKNIDKVLTWLFTVGMSLVLIWSGPHYGSWLCVLLIAIGQMIPPINVLCGRRMIKTIGDGFRVKLDKIVRVYEKKQLSNDTRRAIDDLIVSMADLVDAGGNPKGLE